MTDAERMRLQAQFWALVAELDALAQPACSVLVTGPVPTMRCAMTDQERAVLDAAYAYARACAGANAALAALRTGERETDGDVRGMRATIETRNRAASDAQHALLDAAYALDSQ